MLRVRCFNSAVILVGLWVGNTLYGKLDDAAFRKAILILLPVSGVVLVVPAAIG
jgi:hypothetical protein